MLDGKRIAILVEEDFEDSELIEPMKALKEAGARVVIVGTELEKDYQGKKRTKTIRAETIADRVKAEDFDAIIIPGGYAPDRMRLHKSVIDLVRKAYDLGKVIAASGNGPQLLILADIVRGHRLTSWPSIAVDLKNAGADWVDEPVVQDSNIITSRRPADIPVFNKRVIEAIEAIENK